MRMEHSENFKAVLEEKTREAESIIAVYLPKEEGFAKELAKAMNYSMTAGGKRLRPLLLQESFRLFGGTGEAVKPFMAAMEMIHTHSLIHDDLPALDNDEYRRGPRPTHILYGEAMAILAGDALLNYAYETAVRAFEIEPGNPAIGKALRILTKKTGIYGMLGGQCVDVEAAGREISREKLDFIYCLKTSALIEASMMVGAALAGASEAEIKVIEDSARDIGLAFQIRDDILDVTSTTDELGKSVFSDEKNDKTTYVTIEGIEKAKSDVEEISKRAVSALQSLDRKNDVLEELVLMLVNRKK